MSEDHRRAALSAVSLTDRAPRIRHPRSAALAVVLAVLGVLTTLLGLTTEDSTPLPATRLASPAHSISEGPVTRAGPLHPPSPGGSSAPAMRQRAGMSRSVPVRLRIPAIEVDTGLMALGLREDGTLQVPPLRGNAPAGWYRHSPTPGEVGASVLAGHVDTARDGPAVFHRLRELAVGDPIEVRRKDGSVARFAVTRVAVFAKQDFPSAEVYAPPPHAGLRLITCGGVFDRGEGSYRSNVVVFADAVT